MTTLVFPLAFLDCQKDKTDNNSSANGTVRGAITDSKGQPLANVKVTIEHTVWFDKYVYGYTNNQGAYSVEVPADPAGSWTAKAQVEKSAYGQTYRFDLDPSSTAAFSRSESAQRNFTWKLSGAKPGGGFYGAHVDLYAFGTDVQPQQVKLVFTPVSNTLIDGTAATAFERMVEDVAGTFMVKDIPVGKYKVKAVLAGKTLLLDNRHDNNDAALEKEVVFGKNSNLGETEYNIEFWLTEL